MVACNDTLELSSSGTEIGGEESYKGEKVLFAAGTTANSVSTRADGDGGSGSGTGNSYNETPGKTYYMPDSYRFVCRMYYKAATGENAKYDVSGNTDVTAWLKVKGDVGNSLYWRNSFPTLDESISNLFDTYGNDAEATCFYWQNRKEHAFLAWTDLNKAKTIGYDPTPNSGTLKFQPEDEMHIIRTGQKQILWVDNGFEVSLNDGTEVFADWENLRKYLETGNNYSNIKRTPDADIDFTNQQYYYAYGWSCKYRQQKGASYEEAGDENHRKYGWYEYQMFYDKLTYTGATSGSGIIVRNNAKGEPAYLYSENTRKYLAEIEIKFCKTDEEGTILSPEQSFSVTEACVNQRTGQAVDNKTVQDGDKVVVNKLLCGIEKPSEGDPYYYEINADGTPVMETIANPEYNAETNPDVSPTITCKKPFAYTEKLGDTEIPVTIGEVNYTCIQRGMNVACCRFVYNLTDEYGNVKYDENKPRYTFYYKQLQEKKEAEVTKELPANVYDLTRTCTMTSINDQPDIAQALTIQAPLGATQTANRVNLYFKHQFSLIQVNVKSSADLSVVINKNHIQKVELLGVSEKAYVFTELDEDGKVEPTTYESVDVSKYSDEVLARNQYGTAFNMFGLEEPSAGYIKSYNALTFGKLQAIRITWNEAEDGSGITHESTYHVADENLKNLKSGRKYIWNIELRRGTLAIVRTEIVDWIVPANELEYETSGTITD